MAQLRSSAVNRQWRWFTNHMASALAVLATVLVIAPLVAIFIDLVYKGASSLDLNFFTKIPAPVGETGGGMANSIVGSGVLLGLASLLGNTVAAPSCRRWCGSRRTC
jgi:phosphate transport system permease protein